MTERMPFCGESGQEQSNSPELSYTAEREMPLGFQELERACRDYGIGGAFLDLILEPGMRDFRAVFPATVDMLASQMQLDRSVVEKMLHDTYEVTLHDDELPVETDYPKW